MRRTTEHTRTVSVPDGATAARIACLECGGTGWWQYGPDEVPGIDCVDCKGTGRQWVGLY